MIITCEVPRKVLMMDFIKHFQSTYAIDVDSIDFLGGFIDKNYLVSSVKGEKYLFKLHSKDECKNVLEMQNQVLIFLSETITQISLPRPIASKSGHFIEKFTINDKEVVNSRLLTYVSGIQLGDFSNYHQELIKDIGRWAGVLDNTLKGFSHVGAFRPGMPWDLNNAVHTGQLSRYCKIPEKKRIAEYFLNMFEAKVYPKIPDFSKGVTHNDFHRYSILVNQENDVSVSGVIDFGDTVWTSHIFNVGISLSDILVNSKSPLDDTSLFLAAYHKENKLNEVELDCLYYVIGTRLSLYLILADYYRKMTPENPHPQMKEKEVWVLLKSWLEINPIQAASKFKVACGYEGDLKDTEKRKNENRMLRKRCFSESNYLHYKEPIYLKNSALTKLYDHDGNTYLDFVNNVSQWGHCHPVIVNSIKKQVVELNTNNRYLYDGFPEYAEKLLKTFPAELNVCFFVNSGSEANDLALRLAKVYTKNTELVVLDNAYHGNSWACTEISPNRLKSSVAIKAPKNVHTLEMPDTFRGRFKNEFADVGALYANDFKRILSNLGDKKIAAFFGESILGIGGQMPLPENYLKHIYDYVRKSGGVCVADEVQVGFGRTGEYFWCFESQNVIPDIVTIGKPIGNGHPMAAVICKREIANAFDKDMVYFNTFGGNPVACAAGMAVLNVYENEYIKQNVILTSDYLFKKLNELKANFNFVGDVRGKGLFIGVDIVKNKQTMTPDPDKAIQIVEEMKQRFILLNINGVYKNVLKIKPPLIISIDECNEFIKCLKETFKKMC